MERLILADASEVSGADFFRQIAPLFGKPDTAREATLAALETERRNAIQRTFALPKLADQIDARAAVNAEYAARVEALRSFPPELLPENRDRWVA